MPVASDEPEFLSDLLPERSPQSYTAENCGATKTAAQDVGLRRFTG
jgi:hypothetical protein